MPKDVQIIVPVAIMSLVSNAQNTGGATFRMGKHGQIAVLSGRRMEETFSFDATPILVDAFSFICHDFGHDACVGISDERLCVCLSKAHRKTRQRAASLTLARERIRTGDYDMRAVMDYECSEPLKQETLSQCAAVLALLIRAQLTLGYPVEL